MPKSEGWTYLTEVIEGNELGREAAVHTEETPIDESGDGERAE